MMIGGKMLRYLALTTVVGSAALLGCESLVSTDYLGESRLTLEVSVENGSRSGRDPLEPALAYIDGTSLRFSTVDWRGEFPANFQVNVYNPPKGTWLTPLDPLLAYESGVAVQYLAAIPKRLVDTVVELNPTVSSEPPTCWNGSCDDLPGRRREAPACDSAADPSCQTGPAVVSACRDQECATEKVDESALPAALRPLVGFALGHVVLYVRERLPPKSWAALRLGAPDGLDAGYHLAVLREPGAEELVASRICTHAAHEQARQAYQATRAEALSEQALLCFTGSESSCDPGELPSGEAAQVLAEMLAAAEVEQGCLELAADISPVRDPSDQTLTIRIGDSWLEWSPAGTSQPAGRMNDDAS
jgi:hypothetical protein